MSLPMSVEVKFEREDHELPSKLVAKIEDVT